MSTLSNNDIAKAIYLISKDKTNAEVKSINVKIVEFLARKGLLSKAKNILERLDKIINYENKRIVAKVLSAENLGIKLKKELMFFLKERYKAKEVVLAEALDPKLLGGLRLEVNDEVIDLTVKNKIKKLQEYLVRKI